MSPEINDFDPKFQSIIIKNYLKDFDMNVFTDKSKIY